MPIKFEVDLSDASGLSKPAETALHAAVTAYAQRLVQEAGFIAAGGVGSDELEITKRDIDLAQGMSRIGRRPRGKLALTLTIANPVIGSVLGVFGPELFKSGIGAGADIVLFGLLVGAIVYTVMEGR